MSAKKTAAEPTAASAGTFKTYYALTKPGIIYGNALTAIAGFLYGSRWHVDVGLFAAMLAGTSLVIASACVTNNFTDRGIDAVMARTKKRALVRGTIPGRSALTFAAVLAVLGFALLIFWTNALVVLAGAIGLLDYVVLYGIAKRRSVYGTIAGSISGAVPVLAGYVAATDKFDTNAALLFLVLVAWQMPHFYAIAIYRLSDYKAAHIPVWPAVRGVRATKRQIVLFTALFLAASVALAIFGSAGFCYLTIMLALGIAWLWLGVQGFSVRDSEKWARKMFFFSLVVMLGSCAAIAIGTALP